MCVHKIYTIIFHFEEKQSPKQTINDDDDYYKQKQRAVQN